MAKQINKNWALIESAGYTIQRGISDNWPAHRYEATPLAESIEWQIACSTHASKWHTLSANILRAHNPGADISKQTLRAVITAKNIGLGKLDTARWEALGRCSECANCHGWLCTYCAKAAITPALARECNGEAAWAAARNGGKLDAAMATMIENTPALRAERERRALAAAIPATPTPTRHQSGRL